MWDFPVQQKSKHKKARTQVKFIVYVGGLPPWMPSAKSRANLTLIK
jgi:hypothetical protein